MVMLLKGDSSPDWLQAVMDDFDGFLLDHAANEKKASGVALTLAAHYPDKPDLVAAMIDLAIEELSHYRDVFKLIRARSLTLPPDTKDLYVNQLRALIRRGSEHYFLDRLLVAAVIEARGLERFSLIAGALPLGPLKTFYQNISQSEARHAQLFVSLAEQFYPRERVSWRWDSLVTAEAQILVDLPIRALLH
ncbi:MAG: tRNA-(ms[2]io[6]A)-hydroxylase [Acaryochloridaceae cyanobacterium CSU_5_19]|nr:tRNA-(ms[2]io[6]A)-hydroxylase [Acaryochloridaceae cyanobacterium CSU_5_19]